MLYFKVLYLKFPSGWAASETKIKPRMSQIKAKLLVAQPQYLAYSFAFCHRQSGEQYTQLTYLARPVQLLMARGINFASTNDMKQHSWLNLNVWNSSVQEMLLTDWIIMVAMYREDRNRNIQVWVFIIDNWMTAVFEVLFLITQKLNGHRPNGQISEANISIKFNTWLSCDTMFKAICLTLSVILVLYITRSSGKN
jgi:hypothetical protein